MKKRVSDYYGEFLVKNGIIMDFTVPGGGAMHLDDAFAHTDGMTCIFVQHEQSAAIAAEAYARLHIINKSRLSALLQVLAEQTH